MPRIAFNDAKETVHTVSWPLKGLYSSTGKKKKATAVLAASFPPKGGPGDCLPPSQGGLSLTLPHQGCWKRPVTEPPRSSRKKVSGEDDPALFLQDLIQSHFIHPSVSFFLCSSLALGRATVCPSSLKAAKEGAPTVRELSHTGKTTELQSSHFYDSISPFL